MTTTLKLFVIAMFAYAIAATGAIYGVAEAAGADAGPAVTAPAAAAPAASASVPDPQTDGAGWAAALLERVQKSEWLPVFGCVLMLCAWALRALLGGWMGLAWAKSRLGGRAIAYGASLALTIGTAVSARQPMTMALLATALAAAWVASGQWEDRKDLAGKGG